MPGTAASGGEDDDPSHRWFLIEASGWRCSGRRLLGAGSGEALAVVEGWRKASRR